MDQSSFKSCVANLGGAIYASNIDNLVITNSSFESNIAFRGYSQNIFSYTVKQNITLYGSSFTSYHNSIYINDAVYL